MTMGSIKRRALLKGAAAAAALPTVAFADGLRDAQAAALDTPGVQAALAIGREALHQGAISAEVSPLLTGFGLAPRHGQDPVALYRQLAPSIPARTARDFQAGETVRISGWVFSRSEARFCALITLAADGIGAAV